MNLDKIEAEATTKATDAIAPTEGAESDYVELFGDTARDRIIEKMARAMNIATDGHDRYWSGYVKSAKSAHKVVADYLASTAPSPEAPAVDARGLIRAGLTGLANHVRACAAYEKLRGDIDIVDQAIAALSAPAVDAPTTGAVALQSIIDSGRRSLPKHKGGNGENMVYLTPEMYSALGRATDRANVAHPASEPEAAAIHYPECWDTAAYPTVESALSEVYAAFKCTNHIGASEPKALTLTDEQKNAMQHAEKILRAVKLYGLAALIADRGSEGGKS